MYHDDNILTSNATMKHTSADPTADIIRSIQKQQKITSPYLAMDRLFYPFSISNAPGVSS